jgi:hypothetical protein
MTKFKHLLVVLSIIIPCIVLSQNIQIAEDAINYLASDSLEGRFPGTDGDIQSIEYISNKFVDYQLNPFDFGYKQNFSIVTGIMADATCYARCDMNSNSMMFTLGTDFMPLSFSANKSLGQSITILPKKEKEQSVLNGEWLVHFIYEKEYETITYRKLIDITLEAQEKGAGGLIFVSETNLGDDSEFYPLIYSRSMSSLSIPVIQFSRDAFLKLLQAQGYKGKNPFKAHKFIHENSSSFNFEAIACIFKKTSETANIAAYIESNNSDEWIVIGAHYDHLGMGGPDSGSRAPELNQIHNGADDNASGTAMVLMLAEYYTSNPPNCNIAFVLFGAEEQGLIGSKYFVNNLPMPKSNIKAMLNFDMVGRLKDSSLSIIGTNSAEEFNPILTTWQNKPLALKLGGSGNGGSDQASFLSERIPVLFFCSGMHEDYHTPNDDIEFINFNGMEDIAKLAIQVIDSISKQETKLTFKVKDETETRQGHGGGMKVKLGIMPDMTGGEGNGLTVDGVTPGGIADKAGIEKGDVIIEMNGKKVGGIYEYMHIMSDFEPGQTVETVILRNNEEKNIKIKF